MQIQLIVPLLVWLTNPAPRLYDPGVVHVEDGSTPAELERFRIQRHLALVEATLRRETPLDLAEGPGLARARLLDELHLYAERGEFPQNLDFPDRRIPYFIDEFGTACAVGHLMIVSGAEQLAHEIARDENNDVVADIDHPGVGSWLAANGLTAAEAAWIQPSYDACGFDGTLTCGSDGVTYACAYVATECAMVEIAGEGPCNEGDEVVGVEICPATGDTDTTDEGDSNDGEPKSKGCSVADPEPIGIGLGLLVLVAIRRRRRAAAR